MSGVIEHLNQFDPKFPVVTHALRNPNGLLAAGGNLKPSTLLEAYKNGIYPCSNNDQPIFWWCPDPRAVLFSDELHVPRSLRRQLRQGKYHVTMDMSFECVVQNCAYAYRDETWLLPDLIESLNILHQMGHAHSVEVWEQKKLVGGLYGISIGRYFSGESMFSFRPNAAKIALACLARQLKAWQFPIIDCQQPSTHVELLGARLIKRTVFLRHLEDVCARDAAPSPWVMEHFPACDW